MRSLLRAIWETDEDVFLTFSLEAMFAGMALLWIFGRLV